MEPQMAGHSFLSFRIHVLTWVQDHVRLWSYIQLIYTVFTLYICVHNVHIYKVWIPCTYIYINICETTGDVPSSVPYDRSHWWFSSGNIGWLSGEICVILEATGYHRWLPVGWPFQGSHKYININMNINMKHSNIYIYTYVCMYVYIE